MSKIYFVHAATNVGIPVVRASRATINEALREAGFELSGEEQPSSGLSMETAI
jgi:septum formation inhibitor-activating ATPase MinD